MAFETLDGKNLDGEETKTVEEDNERVEQDEEEKSDKSVKKRQRKRKGAPTSTPVQRPSRERKVVQWYSAEAAETISSPKGLIIHQGNGTPLKDIPNVAFKLSKRKSDENLQTLHRILFGKRTKTHNLKRNLQQFSGFVWVENKEKQREKIRERLDKFVKEQLLDFCDVLDIPVSTATKKDEILGRLLEFLESPHATTEVSLADKEQSQKSKKLKRKKRAITGSASRGTSSKKQKRSAKAKKSDDEDEFESADTNHLSDEDDNLVTMRKEESNQEDDDSPGEEDKTKEKVSKKSAGKKSMKRGSGAKVKAEKGSPKNVGKSTESESSPKAKESPEKPVESQHFVSENGIAIEDKVAGSHSKSKNSTRKNQKGNEKESQKNLSDFSESKKNSNLRVQSSGEEGTRSGKSDVTEPSRDEMHSAVSGILNDVDFNTATLSDVLKKLETIFSMNLMHRKLEVKSIIEEIMSSMTDEEDDEEDDAGEADNGSEEDMS